jgi:hypothetical protein
MDERRQGGQVLPIFVFLSVVLLGGSALITDVTWWWTIENRAQRAADAGALAGAIYLPGNQSLAFSAAISEAAKNGFVNGVGGVTVTPRRDPGDARKLIVDVDTTVETNFARVFCWQGGPCLRNVDVGVTGAASFVLPVPMGSPDNYYGVFGKLRTPNGGTTSFSDADTGWVDMGVTEGPDNWQFLNAVYQSDDVWATSSTDLQPQQWRLGSSISFPGNLSSITGVEVGVEASTSAGTSCQIRAELSWNDGSNWTSSRTVPAAGLTTNDTAYAMGGQTDVWGRSGSWTASNFTAANFRVRLTNLSPGSCTGDTRVDHLRIRVFYRTSTFTPDANIPDPYGNALAPRGLWGTFINQGADKINGDAYLPKWDPRTSRTNAQYDPNTYYHYAIEMPAGSSNGEVWIYDPVFCATSGNGQYGTGDRWFSSSRNATSAYYTLWEDDDRTPFLFNDDVIRAESGSLFANIRASDASLGGPTGSGIADCSVGATSNTADGRYWHNRWWKVPWTLEGGRTYRIHTRSTDPGNADAMNDANGHNSFALWASASGGTPRIYGLGAMEAFTPLNGGYDPAVGCTGGQDGCAEFYLAQIDAEHAGKTMVISLWDPGDTGVLPANLKILEPTPSGYAETTFSYSATPVANGAVSSCATNSSTSTDTITTNTGSSSRFNGCWLTIEIPLPTDYAAPRPSTEPASVEGGWWKIRYIMGGAVDDNAFDLTTWQVELRGNPVHLVPES